MGLGRGVLKRLTAVPADEEDGVKVFGVADELLEFLCLLEKRFLVVQEVHRYLVVFVDGAGVQGRFAAGGGGDGDLGVGGELLVWVCEFGLGGIVSFVSVVKARECGLRVRDGVRGGVLTKYHPVGLPVVPNLLWEERTTRTFG